MRAADHVAAVTAIQAHEVNVIRRCRYYQASVLRATADEYEQRALEADVSERKELEWMAFGIRVAAQIVEP